MNTDDQIKELLKKMRSIAQRIRWLRAHKTQLTDLPPVSGSSPDGAIDFDNLPHKEIVKVIRHFGGKWKKTPASGVVGKIDYETEIDGVRIRCWSGEPPPSCKIVEVEELVPEQIIPASVRKVRKMVCQPSLAATIAQAQDKVGL